jgi:hypothetical protein
MRIISILLLPVLDHYHVVLSEVKGDVIVLACNLIVSDD